MARRMKGSVEEGNGGEGGNGGKYSEREYTVQ